jgi:osmoprotectant transport system ATP-binding protein
MRELADLTNISVEILDRKPDQLSGGQAQRISLMRALMLDPPVALRHRKRG